MTIRIFKYLLLVVFFCILGMSCNQTCPPGERLCGVVCAAIKIDPFNCGACGKSCFTGHACRNGFCSRSCTNEEELCGGFCVKTNSSVHHCGKCGVACTNGKICADGVCAHPCEFSIDCPQGNLCEQGACIKDPTYSNDKKNIGISVWPLHLGGKGPDYGYQMATDSQDNVFITGSFDGVALFGKTKLTTKGQYDIFIAKFSKKGALQWVKSIGGSGTESGQSIAVDSKGSVYVAGVFRDTLDISGAENLRTKGGSDICLIKFSGGGSIQWAKSIGGTGNESGPRLIVDNLNQPVVIGNFEKNIRIGNTTLQSADLEGIFITKMSPDGRHLWVKGAESQDSFGEKVKDLAVDTRNSIYVMGHFTKKVRFARFTQSAGSSGNIFITKLSSTGVFQWVSGVSAGTIEGRSITMDSKDNFWIAGHFSSIGDFLGKTPLTSGGGKDIFVAKYNSEGRYQFAKSAGGNNDVELASATVDRSGQLYLTGHFTNNAAFDKLQLRSRGGKDIFVVRMGSNQQFVWGLNLGGSLKDTASHIVTTSSGTVFASGTFQGRLQLGDVRFTSRGSEDIIISTFCHQGTCTCPTGLSSCNGNCVSLQNDRENCGKCGTTCATGYFCAVGKCTPIKAP